MSSRIEVHKFGGTSVGDATRIARAAELLESASRQAAVVAVSSAMSGVTDVLIALTDHAVEGARSSALDGLRELLERHREAAHQLSKDQTAVSGVGDEIERVGRELEDLLEATALLRELTPRTKDRVLACGEKLAVRLVALALSARGVKAHVMDADGFLETDDRFGSASPLQVVADRTICAAIRPQLEDGVIPVVTGFCGRAPDGGTTTLGRGGSDYTATLIAGAIDADEVTIWTDVSGVYSADPRVVPDARVVPQLHYREAAELSYYGAKVLHQRTMIPVSHQAIPVRTRNSFQPSDMGTVVDNRFTPGSHPVKAISAIRDQCMISVEGKGMAGVPGVAARVFSALAAKQISVTMISQSSSESSISLVVPAGDANAAEAALKRAFRDDLSRGDVEEIVVRRGVGLVAAVGLGMAHTPGIAGRVFAALGRDGVNVLAIAQGSSELNISLAVGADQVDEAVRSVHGEFGLHRLDTGADDDTALDILLLGCGSIGRAVVEQLVDRSVHVFERFGLRARVVAISDRSGYLLDPKGLDRERLDEALRAKVAGRRLADLTSVVQTPNAVDMVRDALSYRLSRPVLVDVSDSDSAHDAFLEALRLGADVVTANKKPLAGDSAVFESLFEHSTRHGRLLRAEATVGAGLPVVDTLEMLLATGDQLRSAEGCLSGTLGFLMSRLEAGELLSEAVQEAVSRGYTEPDPVADLCGADVVRKAIIIARLSGLDRGDMSVKLEGLCDAEWSGLDTDELFERLRTLDAEMASRVEAATAAGRVLRYVARVDAEGISVGPEAVPKDSPLGGLAGSDNMIVFQSDRYDDRPLAVTGPGAGIDVTAMGVLGDILRVAAERR